MSRLAREYRRFERYWEGNGTWGMKKFNRVKANRYKGSMARWDVHREHKFRCKIHKGGKPKR